MGEDLSAAERRFHEHFMELALRESARAAAEGEVPCGCVAVLLPEGCCEKGVARPRPLGNPSEARVLARAHNQVEQLHDPTAHAEMIAITEHAPAMQGSCGPIYFHNLQATRYPFDGIEVLFGVELNIMDYEGTVDLDEKGLKRTDLRIASMHVQCIKPGTEAENTRGILGAIQNPYVDIIGHPDDSRFPMTYEPPAFFAFHFLCTFTRAGVFLISP